MKTLFILFISSLIGFYSFGQNSTFIVPSTSSIPFIGSAKQPVGLYIGMNLPPIQMGEFDLEIEWYNSKHLEYHVSIGMAQDPKRGTYIKVEKDGFTDVGSGTFIRIGADYNLFDKSGLLRNSLRTYNPFAGFRIITSRIQETNKISTSTSIISNSIEEEIISTNIGVAITLGTVFNFDKRISLKLGAQIGIDILDNRLYSYGYNPGTGVDWNPLRTQIIGVLRYRLVNSKKLVSMQFSR